jgi:hypothetical protein
LIVRPPHDRCTSPLTPTPTPTPTHTPVVVVVVVVVGGVVVFVVVVAYGLLFCIGSLPFVPFFRALLGR